MKITVILSAIAAATLVSAGKLHDLRLSATHSIVPNAYIIEYEEHVNHADAQNALNAHKINYKVRNEYNIFHGSAITVNSKHGGKHIAAILGVKNVWPIALYSVPMVQKSKVKPTDPEANSLHHMTGVDVLHKKYKLTGKGVKIGVIDTGIDYLHPAFAAPGANAGCFARYGKNCRIKHGWDFVGDAYTGANTPVPDSDPMDCQGHGSHVAGIIGGNALNLKVGPKPPQPFVGVAPEVTFGAYRVFGCNGQTSGDVIMAAMELAFNDGMDVINMSLGGGSAYKEDPEAVLAEKLIARGMALAAAAGNDGTSGVWEVSNSGLGDSSTSVASFDNLYGSYDSVTYGGVVHPYSPSTAWGQRITLPANATLVPIFEKNGALSDGCDPAIYSGVNVKGKVVLTLGDVTRCKSGGRGANALQAGAAGILVQTTPLGIAALGGVPNLPMGSIDHQGGEDMIAVFKKTPNAPLIWSTAQATFRIEGGGSPSGFSSFGLDGELRSKPDLGAPGGNILSTYPLAKGGYQVMSGTSMATPYVAGSHALYMQAKKAKPHGDVVRKVFKNTATISSNTGSKTKTSVTKQGAGLINVLNAVLTTSSISPDHIDLLDTVHLKKTVKITLKNEGRHTESYTLSHIPADALNSYPKGNSFPLGTPLIEADYATIKFSVNKIKIPAGKSAKITLSFTEPKNGDATQFPLYSGFVVATPGSGGVAVHVPYTGLKGDFSKVPMQDKDLGFPGLVVADSKGKLQPIPAGNVFDLTNSATSVPIVATRLGSHSPDQSIRIFDAKNNFVGFLYSKDVGPAFGQSGRLTNMDSHTGQLSFTQWTWQGQVLTAANLTLSPVTVPTGTYDIVVASQKKFTKGVFPQDYEVYDLKTVSVKTA